MPRPAHELPAALPDIEVTRWFNTKEPLSLASLRGRPVMLHTFQMLCPACVSGALPQAERIHRMFAKTDLVVLGLHTVFEHHAAMTDVALEAFIHEYRLTFPIAVDKPGEGSPLPVTMAAYGLQGTPSTLLVDRHGMLRHHHFGTQGDLALGFFLGKLLAA